MGGKHLVKPQIKRKFTVWILILLLLLAAAYAVLAFSRGEKENTPRLPQPVESYDPEKESASIAIPGYEYLTLAANTKKQSISLDNPKTNTCYFLVSLYMEDGTLLWQSDYLAPGEASKPIELSLALEAGTYNAVLHYDCFRMNSELSPLNGAETKLTLRVK